MKIEPIVYWQQLDGKRILFPRPDDIIHVYSVFDKINRSNRLINEKVELNIDFHVRG